jgi:hypothetical protein
MPFVLRAFIMAFTKRVKNQGDAFRPKGSALCTHSGGLTIGWLGGVLRLKFEGEA